MKIHTILFVKDQAASTKFYSAVFDQSPSLNVPGMTEFRLNDIFVLGLMPINGARKILGEEIIPENQNSFPKSEIYFRFENFHDYFSRAVENGGKVISPIAERNWGDTAGYVADLDGHVIAFSSLAKIPQ